MYLDVLDHTFYISYFVSIKHRLIDVIPTILAKTAKNGVVLDTKSNVQPI